MIARMFQARRSDSDNRLLSLPRRAVVMLTLAALMLAATALPAFARESEDGFIVGPDRGMDELRARPAIASLALPNGNGLDFFAVPNEKGIVEGVVVMEAVEPGNAGIQSDARLQRADAAEIFNAFAGAQVEMPSLLMDLYGKPELGQRGWALDMVVNGDFSLDHGDYDRDLVVVQPGTQGPPDYVTCPEYGVTQWSNGVNSYQGLFNGAFKSTWDGPDSIPAHWYWTGNLGFGDAAGYQLNGQAKGVSAFYASVLYCWEDSDEAFTVDGQYAGNYISFAWRYNASNPWQFFQSDQMDTVGKVVSYLYYPGDAFYFSATKLDFRVRIKNAKPADLFHIGAAWQYNGPGSFESN